MGVHIYVKPEDVWQFFKKNTDRLENEMVSVAENEETRYSIYLTEDKGFPLLCVYKEEKEIFTENAVSEPDCSLSAKNLYIKYLFPVVVTLGKERFAGKQEELDEEAYEDLQNSLQDFEDEIYEREDELRFAAIDFLQIVLGFGDMDGVLAVHGDELISAFVDDMCEYLMDNHGISVYRPMFVMDEDTGTETLVEYPYDEDSIIGNND